VWFLKSGVWKESGRAGNLLGVNLEAGASHRNMACAFYISVGFGKTDKIGKYLFEKPDKISRK
jgi:hypothetical protein